MVRDFPLKLKITAALLGCAAQKDLCARFRAINPNTDFEIERSYKWMQGVALPRSAQVYEDWALLLGLGRSAADLTSCSIDEFVDAVCEHYRVSRSTLMPLRWPAAGAAPGTPEAKAGSASFPAYLAGAYACYSYAWSPHYRGRIVRSSLLLEPGVGRTTPGLMATFCASVSTGRFHMHGPVALTTRSIYLDVAEPDDPFRLFMCLFLPASPPANVLAGVLAGAAYVDSYAQPAVTRVIMVRVPDAVANTLEESNRYLEKNGESPSSDLAALGMLVGAQEAAELDELFGAVLRDAGRATPCRSGSATMRGSPASSTGC